MSGVKTYLASVLFFLAVGALAAQSPLSRVQSIPSENGRYAAKICQSPNGVCEIQMTAIPSGELLWSQWIDWDRLSSGATSNDGSVFAIVYPVYVTDRCLVLVNRKGLQEGYSAKTIAVERQYLARKGAAFAWIENAEKSAVFLYDGSGKAIALSLLVVDGRIVRIRL